LGGMVAFTPFDGNVDRAKEMVGRMYDAGLMSFIAGGKPTRIRFLLPLGCVTNDHIDLALQIVEQAVSEMS
jgi:acetylornithine aminotransferase